MPSNCESLKNELKKAIISLIEKGVVFFGAGGALGFDMLAEEIVLQLKEYYPQIRLVLVLPCPTQEQTLKWSSEQKERYNNIYKMADKIRILSPHYTNSCMLNRNRHMINNSAHLISYLRENHGGTYYTVNYAEKQGIDIIRL